MQQFWVGKNVDFMLLIEQIDDFFKKKNFKTVKEKIPAGYKISVLNSTYFGLQGHIWVTIKGYPNNFAVKLEKSTKKRKISLFSLEQTFLGGFLILRDLKIDENWLKLKKEFWRYVENSVLRLTNTAQYSNSH